MGWLRAYFWLGLVMLVAGFALLALAAVDQFTAQARFDSPPWMAALALTLAGSALAGIGRASREPRPRQHHDR